MSDPQMNQNPQPAQAKAGGQQQDPLAALEAILQDAKKNQTGAVDPSVAANLAAQEEAQKLAEIAQLEEQKKIEDQQNLQVKLEELHQVTSTPEYQVRLQQDQQKKVEQEEKIDSADKIQIRQLGHSKI